MNLVKLLVLGNLAVVSYFILEKGITIDFLPLLAFSVATSISSSPRVLGVSLIIGSLDIPLLFISPIPLVTLAFALSITALSLLSLKIEKVKFVVLPISVVFFFFLGSFPLFLYSFVVLGSTLLLFDKIKDPRPLFTIAIPYFLTQLFFLFFFSLLSSGFSLMLFNEIAFNSKIVLPSVIVILLVIFASEFIENKNVLVSLASLILSVIILFVYPQYALVYSSSSAIVINSIPSEKDIESLMLKNIDNDKVLQDLLLEYKEDLTPLYCNLVNQGNCKAVVKIPSAVPYKINYALCDINKIAECFEKMKQVPPIDIVNFLLVAKNKDLELAERIGELARQVAPSPKLLNILDEIKILKIENLKKNWDPKVWLNREIFGYKITGYLGKGGSSFVLVGEKEGKKYAIKIPILFPSSTATDSYYDFINEYSQLRELSFLSDNIVKFVDSRIDMQAIRKIVKEGDVLSYLNEPPLLVMEYMEGGSSKDLIYNDNVFYN